MPETERIRLKNSQAIMEKINNLDVKNYDTVSKLLPKLIADGSLTLDPSVYTPADPTTVEAKGIGRYLIYDNEDTTNPFSIWAFALAPRQKTSIHDHKYAGTVTVLDGPVSEKYYKPTGESSAKRIDRADRYRFHSTRDDLNETFIHQLKNRKGLRHDTSVTLHIYNMEAHFVNEAGVMLDRRNLDTIYTKDKSIDEFGLSPYKGEYHELRCQF